MRTSSPGFDKTQGDARYRKANLNTIAELRALSGNDLSGSVEVSGYYAANDGAGLPPYYYSSTSTATDNGGTVIRPDSIASGSPGRWLMRFSEDYLLDRWFGTVGSTTTTTANTSSSSNPNTVTVASSSTFAVGQWILIRGAGTSGGGNDLYARIGTLSGTTWTLVDGSGAAVNASATLTGALVYHDDTTPLSNMATAAYDTSLALALRMRVSRGNYNVHELNFGSQHILLDGRETISAAIYYIGSGEADVSTTGDITSGTKTLTVANAAGLIPHRYIRVLTAGPSGDALLARINSIAGPTGNAVGGSQNITGVSSTAGLANGQSVQVIGAGPNGGSLTASITNISGSTVTLDTAASVSVTGTVFFRTGVSTTVTLDTAASTTASGQSVLFKGGYLMRTTAFSWGGFKGMRFYGRDFGNTTAAENIIQFRGSGPDMMSDINWLTFAHCYGDAIHVGHQVASFNFNTKKVRYDGVGAHPLYIAGSTTNENRPVKIFEFTVDNNLGTAQIQMMMSLGWILNRKFSAVASTDIITTLDSGGSATAHGWSTGQVVRVDPAGGGLSTATDYYVINVSANTIKLANSLTNAFAGTAIDITSDITSASARLYIPEWGKSVVGVGNTQGLSTTLENSRVEQNFPMKRDTGVLFHEYATAASQAGFFTAMNIKGYSSTARYGRRPAVYSQTGEINVLGDGDNSMDFTPADIYRADTGEEIWPNGRFRGHIEWRRRVTQDHGLKLNGRKIQVHDFADTNRFMRYSAGDIVLHPPSVIATSLAAATKTRGDFGKVLVAPTAGTVQPAGGQITTTATLVSGNPTITNVQTSTSSTSNEPSVGSNITITSGTGGTNGAGGTNFNCRILSYDPRANGGTIVVDAPPTGNGTPFIISHQAGTWREIGGEWVSAMPSGGPYQKGDYANNNNPTEQGSAPNKYVIHGWRCTVGGASTSTWVEDRRLTGNP